MSRTSCFAPPRSANELSAAAPVPGGEATRTLSSAELLGGSQAVHIEHLGSRYVLRATRSGKLILTK